nr:hypothetical protein [Bradyrhizobium diazoefficiens]
MIQRHSNRNELLVVSLKGNDWTAEPLLLFANSFGSSLLFESASDVCRVVRRRRLIASGVASAAFFEFQSAATRAGLIAPSFHDVAAYTGTRSGRIHAPISGMNDSELMHKFLCRFVPVLCRGILASGWESEPKFL